MVSKESNGTAYDHVSVDRTEYNAFKALSERYEQEVNEFKVKVLKLEQRYREMIEIHSRQLTQLQRQDLELTYVRARNLEAEKTILDLRMVENHVTAARKIADLEETVLQQRTRLKQAEGTKLFENNQRLTEENIQLRKRLKELDLVVESKPR